jgi:hypothetical protein
MIGRYQARLYRDELQKPSIGKTLRDIKNKSALSVVQDEAVLSIGLAVSSLMYAAVYNAPTHISALMRVASAEIGGQVAAPVILIVASGLCALSSLYCFAKGLKKLSNLSPSESATQKEAPQAGPSYEESHEAVAPAHAAKKVRNNIGANALKNFSSLQREPWLSSKKRTLFASRLCLK